MFEKSLAYAARHPLRVLLGALAMLGIVFVISALLGGEEQEGTSSDNITAPVAPVDEDADGIPDEGIVSSEDQAVGNISAKDPEKVDTSSLPGAERSAYEKYKQYLKSRNWKDEPHFEGSPESRRRATEYLSRQMALYDLPYRGGGIQAEYIRVTEEGRYVIRIRYSGSLQAAQGAWRQYLAKYKDSGRTYLTIFQQG